MQVVGSMYQVAQEFRIKAVEARLDDRMRLEKRYTHRGQVLVVTAVKAVYVELSLPEEQRRFTSSKVCQCLGLDINNLNSDYYVSLLRDEANVHYPEDVMAELERRGSGGQVPVTPPSGTLQQAGAQLPVQWSADVSVTLPEEGDETSAVTDQAPPALEERADPSLAIGS